MRSLESYAELRNYLLGIEMSDGWFTFMVVVGWCSVANELMLNPWQRGFFILKHPMVIRTHEKKLLTRAEKNILRKKTKE